MDRQTPKDDGDPMPHLLPSRLAALAAMRRATPDGPVLLTGSPGVGKSLLGRALAADGAICWAVVDAAPGMTPGDLLRAFLAELGSRIMPSGDGSARLALRDLLAVSRADGRPAGLILDEAHVASDELLDEVRRLANGLGRPDGPAGIVLSGQTPLARRVDGQALAGLEARLSARIHLLPLDLEEAASLLGRSGFDALEGTARMELIHRDAGGNPGRLLRMAAAASPSAPAPERPTPSRGTPRLSGPLLPTRPPLVDEEGLVEVGWEAEADGEGVPDVGSSGGPIPVADRYAALQAWDEWARNQGREPAEAVEPEDEGDPDPAEPAAGLKAEPGHDFAPYGQLFSRLKSQGAG